MLRLLVSLFGPIFAKEVIERSRRPRYFIARVLYVSILALFMAQMGMTQSFYSVHDVARLARNLFEVTSVIQYLSVFVLVPMVIFPMVAGEREQKTLLLLLTTKLRDREIVVGKWASGLVMVFLLLLAGLPTLALIGLFGGIDFNALFWTTLATLQAMCVVGTVSIYLSTTSKSPLAALLRTYWWLFVWLLVGPVTLLISLRLVSVPGPSVMSFALNYAYVHVGTLFMASIQPAFHGEMVRVLGPGYFSTAFALQSLFAALLLLVSTRRLRHEYADTNKRRWFPLRIYAAIRDGARAWRANQRRRWAPRLLGMEVTNPLWLRARLTAAYDRDGQIGRIQFWCWIAAYALTISVLVVERPNSLRGFSDFMLLVTWTGVLVFVTIYAALSVVGDRRRGLLELVLTTPLSSREIVDGTMAAVIEHIAPILFLPLSLGLFFTVTGAYHWELLAITTISWILVTGVAITLGVTCSVLAKSMPQALIPAASFGFCITVGITIFQEYACGWSGNAVITISSIVLILANIWVHRSTTSFSVGLLLGTIFFFLTVCSTIWRLSWDHSLLSFNPWFISYFPLDFDAGNYDLRQVYYSKYGDWSWGGIHATDHAEEYLLAKLTLPAIWLAMAVQIVGTRLWLIRRLDQWVGRIPEGTHHKN